MAISRYAARSLLAVVLTFETGAVKAQAPTIEWPDPSAEMAKAIALTISQNPGAMSAPNSPITLTSATSRGNVVEIRYAVKDSALFARLKQNADTFRLDKTSYYCNPSRIVSLNRGVVFHEITTAPDNSDQLDYTFDKSTCETLPKPKPADPATLAKLALSIAEAENNVPDKSTSDYRFSGAKANQGRVEERFIVPDGSTVNLDTIRKNLPAVVRGYRCSRYRDFLLQGGAFHWIFVLENGNPVFDFTVAGSDC